MAAMRELLQINGDARREARVGLAQRLVQAQHDDATAKALDSEAAQASKLDFLQPSWHQTNLRLPFETAIKYL